MRIVFIIVIALGLLMAGLGACGIRLANEHLVVDLDVQQALAGLGRAPLTLMDILSTQQQASINDIELIRSGWIAVVLTGTVLFTAGIVGITIHNRTRIERVAAQH